MSDPDQPNPGKPYVTQTQKNKHRNKNKNKHKVNDQGRARHHKSPSRDCGNYFYSDNDAQIRRVTVAQFSYIPSQNTFREQNQRVYETQRRNRWFGPGEDGGARAWGREGAGGFEDGGQGRRNALYPGYPREYYRATQPANGYRFSGGDGRGADDLGGFHDKSIRQGKDKRGEHAKFRSTSYHQSMPRRHFRRDPGHGHEFRDGDGDMEMRDVWDDGHGKRDTKSRNGYGSRNGYCETSQKQRNAPQYMRDNRPSFRPRRQPQFANERRQDSSRAYDNDMDDRKYEKEVRYGSERRGGMRFERRSRYPPAFINSPAVNSGPRTGFYERSPRRFSSNNTGWTGVGFDAADGDENELSELADIFQTLDMNRTIRNDRRDPTRTPMSHDARGSTRKNVPDFENGPDPFWSSSTNAGYADEYDHGRRSGANSRGGGCFGRSRPAYDDVYDHDSFDDFVNGYENLYDEHECRYAAQKRSGDDGYNDGYDAFSPSSANEQYPFNDTGSSESDASHGDVDSEPEYGNSSYDDDDYDVPGSNSIPDDCPFTSFHNNNHFPTHSNTYGTCNGTGGARAHGPGRDSGARAGRQRGGRER